MFGIGYFVRLKSGGHVMVVDSQPDNNGDVRCYWYIRNSRESGSFHVGSLKKASDS
ncbi:DUF2158 domain-containing protein [Vibrio coralliilyticus]|nr:DUF2158 domain-containing protein [Vibrio coralliilyticus]